MTRVFIKHSQAQLQQPQSSGASPESSELGELAQASTRHVVSYSQFRFQSAAQNVFLRRKGRGKKGPVQSMVHMMQPAD